MRAVTHAFYSGLGSNMAPKHEIYRSIINHMNAQEQAWKTAGPTYGLMKYAMVCQELSRRAYDPMHLQLGKDWFTVRMPEPFSSLKLQDTTEGFEAKLIHAQLSSSAQQASDYLQYGIWRVRGMGYVVAFKGTTMNDGLDWLANCNIQLKELDYQGSSMKIHGGVYRRAAAVWTRNMQDQLMADVRRQSQLPVNQEPDTRAWLTGWSLLSDYTLGNYVGLIRHGAMQPQQCKAS